MYGNKLEFPIGKGGGGGAKQKPSVGGVWIFSETAHLTLHQVSLRAFFHAPLQIIMSSRSAWDQIPYSADVNILSNASNSIS